MKVTRRQALGLMAGAGVAAGTGCSRILSRLESKESVSSPQASSNRDVIALNRFGFGPKPGDLDELRDKGREKWFEEQLAAPLDDPLPVMLRLRQLDIFHFTAYELRDLPETEILRQLQTAAILRAVYSPWQLRERMVDFWSNHFNIFARKGLAAYRKPQDERDVVRANTLGSFPKMLEASAKSTAMLLFLDQQASNFSQPNENYARELLELHSLGVDGGYTQKDVMEVARCFTGWTEERGFMKGKGQFRFRPEMHDSGEKIVLGHVIPKGGGVQDGEKVLEIVSQHPATASFVAGKLCRFFLGSSEPKIQDRVAKAYLSSKGEIKPMLREIYAAGEEGLAEPFMKRPFDYLCSSLRALDADTDGGKPLQDHLTAMGQPLYQWPMPDGYPDVSEAWTGSLLGRWNFAIDLCEGRIRGTSVDVAGVAKRMGDADPLAVTFSRPVDSPELDDVVEIVGRQTLDAAHQAALALASPEFQWR